MAAKPIPDGYHSVTPCLIVKGAVGALEFYKKGFGATALFRIDALGGKIGHAEIKIGDSPIMLADENSERGALSPQPIGGTPIFIMLYVENVDDRFKQALHAGATEVHAIQDQFYGDRSGTLKNPYGHLWTIATHVEDVSPEEIDERAKVMHGGGELAAVTAVRRRFDRRPRP